MMYLDLELRLPDLGTQYSPRDGRGRDALPEISADTTRKLFWLCSTIIVVVLLLVQVVHLPSNASDPTGAWASSTAVLPPAGAVPTLPARAGSSNPSNSVRLSGGGSLHLPK